MRSTIFRASVLCLAVLALALAAPAAAQPNIPRNCKLLYADIQTSWYPDESVELGWLSGTIIGGVYLKYEDKEPRIDPAVTKPNLVLFLKEGNIELWVTSDSYYHDNVVVRKFTTLQAIGYGDYTGLRLSVAVEGKFFIGKEGTYILEGLACAPVPKPPKK